MFVCKIYGGSPAVSMVDTVVPIYTYLPRTVQMGKLYEQSLCFILLTLRIKFRWGVRSAWLGFDLLISLV